jgi:hypothetical protein
MWSAAWPPPTQLQIKAGTVQTRHLEITHDEVVGRLSLEETERLGPIVRGVHIMAVRAQDRSDQFPNGSVVIDDQDVAGGHGGLDSMRKQTVFQAQRTQDPAWFQHTHRSPSFDCGVVLTIPVNVPILHGSWHHVQRVSWRSLHKQDRALAEDRDFVAGRSPNLHGA